MSNETVRGNLVDSINEMTKVLDLCQDSNECFEIKLKIRKLFQLLDRVIIATLDSTTDEFDQAIKSLQSLTLTAKAAQVDLDKVADMIKKSATAIGKVEKLVVNVAGVLAIL